MNNGLVPRWVVVEDGSRRRLRATWSHEDLDSELRAVTQAHSTADTRLLVPHGRRT